jgi:ADP-ribose pyrophosphatase YjhB (NUDIX family)
MKQSKLFCHFCGAPLGTRESEGRQRLYCEAERRFIYENPIPAATAVVTDDAGRILLVRRNREPGKKRWALPGGFIEMHEGPAAAAARELEEECGIVARDPSLVDIIYQESGFYGTSLLIIGYSFAGFEGTPRAGDDAEKVRFFAIDALPRLAFEAHGRLIKKYLEKREELRRLWSEEV